MPRERKILQDAQRIVVKVGTSTLTHETGKLNLGRIEVLVRELANLSNQGKEVVLVTSGAIVVGTSRVGLSGRPRTTKEKQAMAAIGQGILMQVYEKIFGEYSCVVAQILLTKADIDNGKRYRNAVNTFNTLFGLNVIPIVNENDTVAVDEIEFGDNDSLSAQVALLIAADLLVILSDIDGLYTADPRSNTDATLVPLVTNITEEVENLASSAGGDLGVGGMSTKIIAAKAATEGQIPVVVANGNNPAILRQILAGEEVGTLFLPSPKDG
ncbi:MAG: glutamate 5-kinase [Firmicutes bacterium]|nr:glutamate 5-kinase [Bacillota bacterium]